MLACHTCIHSHPRTHVRVLCVMWQKIITSPVAGYAFALASVISLSIALGFLLPHIHDGAISALCTFTADNFNGYKGCVVTLESYANKGTGAVPESHHRSMSAGIIHTCEYPYTECPTVGSNQLCWLTASDVLNRNVTAAVQCPTFNPELNAPYAVGVVLCATSMACIILVTICCRFCCRRTILQMDGVYEHA